MARTRVVNYTFNAAGKTITFTDYGTILLDAIYAVVNSTVQKVIYNPSDTSMGGTVATNVLTLEGDTTGMNNTDKLLILYDDELAVSAVSMSEAEFEVTFSLDTAAYVAGDVLADTQVISNAMRVNAGLGRVVGLSLYDLDDQKQPLRVFFLKSNVSMGTENAAPSISDTNIFEITGVVPVTLWRDLGGAAYACVPPPDCLVGVSSATGSKDVYVALVTDGTPTHTASGMKMRVRFERA